MLNISLGKRRLLPVVEKLFEQPPQTQLVSTSYTKICPRYTAWLTTDEVKGVVQGSVLDIPGFPVLQVKTTATADVNDAMRVLVNALDLETQRYLKACSSLGWQPAKRDQGAEVVHASSGLISGPVVSDAVSRVLELVRVCEQKMGQEDSVFARRLALSVIAREIEMVGAVSD